MVLPHHASLQGSGFQEIIGPPMRYFPSSSTSISPSPNNVCSNMTDDCHANSHDQSTTFIDTWVTRMTQLHQAGVHIDRICPQWGRTPTSSKKRDSSNKEEQGAAWHSLKTYAVWSCVIAAGLILGVNESIHIFYSETTQMLLTLRRDRCNLRAFGIEQERSMWRKKRANIFGTRHAALQGLCGRRYKQQNMNVVQINQRSLV